MKHISGVIREFLLLDPWGSRSEAARTKRVNDRNMGKQKLTKEIVKGSDTESGVILTLPSFACMQIEALCTHT